MDMEYILPDANESESSEDKSDSFGGNLLDSDEDSDDSGEILHYYHVKVTNQNELLKQFKQIGNYFWAVKYLYSKNISRLGVKSQSSKK